MLGFKLDIWDFQTFAVIFALLGAFLAVAVFVLGLPGRIAIARKHPDADAINMVGWMGFLAIVPWIQAFLWAFKPTNVVDIRYFPKQEQQNIDECIAKLIRLPHSYVDFYSVAERIQLIHCDRRWPPSCLRPTRREPDFTSIADATRIHVVRVLFHVRIQPIVSPRQNGYSSFSCLPWNCSNCPRTGYCGRFRSRNSQCCFG